MDVSKLECIISQIKSEVLGNDEHSPGRLDRIILDIKLAFIRDWEDNYLGFISNLIKSFEGGVPTPVLSVCGRGTQEIRFTKYLAYMFDKKKSHGIKNSLLKVLFAEIAEKNRLNEEWSCNYVVHNEYSLGSYYENSVSVNCLCDIVIEGSDFFIFIEQKILSNESINENTELGQLNRYSHSISGNSKFSGKNLIKIYLTPNGQLPDKTEGWLPLSHSQIIEKGFELLSSGALGLIAKENLKRFLLDLCIGPYQVTEDLIIEMYDLARQLEKQFDYKNAVRFIQLLNDNRQLLSILLEEKINE